MKVKITDDCVSCSVCVEVCPEVFAAGDDIAQVIVDVVPEEHEAACRQAAEECPSEAIIIEQG